jgi:hypothetical protein
MMELRLKKPRYSKKDYEMIAATLEKHSNPLLSPGMVARIQEATVKSIAQDLAVQFAEDNPMFSRERFLKACGVQE